MDIANQLILVASGLILVSIFAGNISQRFGAPLLLVFLALGMLAGEDGPGGIRFDNYQTTYLVGSVALAIILFDGGLRTRWKDLRSVALPAGILASLGVLITAIITAVAAVFLLGIGWLEGLLVGSLVASTDAAAVFLLLHLRGMRLRDKLRAVLEAEAGLNDPMAVLLTVACVSLLASPVDVGFNTETIFGLAGSFLRQMVGGLVAGVAGGYLLLVIINRLNIASGLYPVMTAAWALLMFSTAQEFGASGFLGAYVAGLVVGNNRHKATLLIDRFHDGLAWLAQIAMFLILGLLVTPSALKPVALPALGIAFVLMVIARPVATWVGLRWFSYSRGEIGFVSWVGLRGAVPIFLGTIPVLTNLPNAHVYFGVVYVIVLTSLIVQGWTVGYAGRRFGVTLPPRPVPPPRFGIHLPTDIGRDMTAYAVQAKSLALRRPLARLPIPDDVDLVSIIRDGSLHQPGTLEYLAAGDDVLLMAPAERLPVLDRLFGERQSAMPFEAGGDLLGLFAFSGNVDIGDIADAYGFWVPESQRKWPAHQFMRRHIWGPMGKGRRLRLGTVELVVAKAAEGKVKSLTLELDPSLKSWRVVQPALIWFEAEAWTPGLAALGTKLQRGGQWLIAKTRPKAK
ncbi:MAG: potassium/proton antiporter [Alphaproteobacteria bacterium]|nr:MAG: potassium/proton antiporter [Alphaproteobacteria bacterium]